MGFKAGILDYLPATRSCSAIAELKELGMQMFSPQHLQVKGSQVEGHYCLLELAAFPNILRQETFPLLLSEMLPAGHSQTWDLSPVKHVCFS